MHLIYNLDCLENQAGPLMIEYSNDCQYPFHNYIGAMNNS